MHESLGPEACGVYEGKTISPARCRNSPLLVPPLMRSAVDQSRLRSKLNGVDDPIMRVHVADKLCILRHKPSSVMSFAEQPDIQENQTRPQRTTVHGE